MADDNKPFDPESLIAKTPQGESLDIGRCRVVLAQWDKETANGNLHSAKSAIHKEQCQSYEDYIKLHPLDTPAPAPDDKSKKR